MPATIDRANTRKELLLPCRLTELEVRRYGQDLSSVLGQIDEVKAEKKAAVDVFKDRLDRLEAKAATLAKAVREESEDRLVATIEVVDRDHRKVYRVRTDTGEAIESTIRAATEADLQAELFHGDARIECDGCGERVVGFREGQDEDGSTVRFCVECYRTEVEAREDAEPGESTEEDPSDPIPEAGKPPAPHDEDDLEDEEADR